MEMPAIVKHSQATALSKRRPVRMSGITLAVHETWRLVTEDEY